MGTFADSYLVYALKIAIRFFVFKDAGSGHQQSQR